MKENGELRGAVLLERRREEEICELDCDRLQCALQGTPFTIRANESHAKRDGDWRQRP
jgi:hypothetical protein